jgi:hypothetical protein
LLRRRARRGLVVSGLVLLLLSLAVGLAAPLVLGSAVASTAARLDAATVVVPAGVTREMVLDRDELGPFAVYAPASGAGAGGGEFDLDSVEVVAPDGSSAELLVPALPLPAPDGPSEEDPPVQVGRFDAVERGVYRVTNLGGDRIMVGPSLVDSVLASPDGVVAGGLRAVALVVLAVGLGLVGLGLTVLGLVWRRPVRGPGDA